MKEKYVGAFWGIVLIILGGIFLLLGRTTYMINDPYVGLAICGGLSLLFFTSYFFSGVQKWGWLFPACIFASSALVILITLIGPPLVGSWIGAPVLLGIAVPFLVAYFLDRTRWWALIPAYVMGVLALITAFADRAPGEIIGTVFMLAAALPFLVVFLTNRSRKWALIPFAILTLIGLLPALTLGVDSRAMGGVIMFLFAAPFFVVYFWAQRNWWALMQAGIFTSIGVVLVTIGLLNGSAFSNSQVSGLGGGILFLGWALTFLALWLRRASPPTLWAIYPAIVLAVLSVTAFVGGEKGLSYAWPLAIIAAGGLLLFNSQRKRSM